MSDDYGNLKGYNPEADLGLGCGLPTQYAGIKKGDLVIDLGSGAGNDCFVARYEVGDIGKVIGITLFAWLAVKINLASLPKDLHFSEIAGIGALAGMGLTVALVISEVAIESEIIQGDVKAGLIISAGISGFIGYLWLKRSLVLR
jgi:hypothetical protein